MADTKVFSFPENGNGNDLATLLALNGNNNGGFLGGIIRALVKDGAMP